MAANKVFRFGPVFIASGLATAVLNPPTVTGGVNAGSSPCYIVLRHIRVVNRTGNAAIFLFYLRTASTGGAPGEEVITAGTTLPGYGIFDWYGALRIDATEYLNGSCGTASALVIEGEGEIGIAG